MINANTLYIPDFFYLQIAKFWPLFFDMTLRTITAITTAIITAKKVYLSIISTLFFSPLFWFVLNFPILTDLAFLKRFHTLDKTLPGSQLAWKSTNFICVAKSKSSFRRLVNKAFSLTKPLKRFTIISFRRPPRHINSSTLTQCPGTSSSNYRDFISLDLKYSIPAIKMAWDMPDTLICALQQLA